MEIRIEIEIEIKIDSLTALRAESTLREKRNPNRNADPSFVSAQDSLRFKPVMPSQKDFFYR